MTLDPKAIPLVDPLALSTAEQSALKELLAKDAQVKTLKGDLATAQARLSAVEAQWRGEREAQEIANNNAVNAIDVKHSKAVNDARAAVVAAQAAIEAAEG